MRKLCAVFARDEHGVSAMEYAIMAGIVAVALAAVGTVFKTNVSSLFSSMNSKVSSASSS